MHYVTYDEENVVRNCSVKMYLLLKSSLIGEIKVKKINNGNWTEWSAILSEIIRVISKSNERVDQNCSSIATLLDPFWNRTIFGEKQ